MVFSSRPLQARRVSRMDQCGHFNATKYLVHCVAWNTASVTQQASAILPLLESDLVECGLLPITLMYILDIGL